MTIPVDLPESDGGFLVPDEYAMALVFRFGGPIDRQVEERKNKSGIWAWILRLIGHEDGYIWIETQEYLDFKAEWKREHQ